MLGVVLGAVVVGADGEEGGFGAGFSEKGDELCGLALRSDGLEKGMTSRRGWGLTVQVSPLRLNLSAPNGVKNVR